MSAGTLSTGTSGQSATLTVSNSILSGTIGGTDLVNDQPAQIGSVANAAVATANFTGPNIVPNLLIAAGNFIGTTPLTSDPQLAGSGAQLSGSHSDHGHRQHEPRFRRRYVRPQRDGRPARCLA